MVIKVLISLWYLTKSAIHFDIVKHIFDVSAQLFVLLILWAARADLNDPFLLAVAPAIRAYVGLAILVSTYQSLPEELTAFHAFELWDYIFSFFDSWDVNLEFWLWSFRKHFVANMWQLYVFPLSFKPAKWAFNQVLRTIRSPMLFLVNNSLLAT